MAIAIALSVLIPRSNRYRYNNLVASVQQDNVVQGFLNLNKPAGFTSHDCVAKVRRLLRLKRVGHGGTLDPAATGVLPIAVGKATRLLQFLREDKAYRATIRLGVQTTTDDLEGEILATQAAETVTLEAVKMALKPFKGKIQQIPPIYSAIQVQGKRLYDLARAGEAVEVPSREVEVYGIEVLEWRAGEFPEVDVAIACGSGTYIRAIARDLGAALNVGGTLAALTRTQSCGFHLEDSLTLEQLEEQIQQNCFEPIPPGSALKHLAPVMLPQELARRWCQGQKIGDFPWEANELRVHCLVQVYDESDRFLGIGELVNVDGAQLLIPKMVFEPL